MAENHKPTRQEEFGEATTPRGIKGAARGNGRRIALNVFDLIVILLVLVVVVLLVVGVRVGDLFGQQEGTEVRLSYTVQMTNVDETFARQIRTGDTVYDVDSGVSLGMVSTMPLVTASTMRRARANTHQ